MLRDLLTRTSDTHCTAPTGRNGGHCGKRRLTGRLADGTTCGSPACALWHADRRT
ncbi:hypothetical protein [Saccharothrix xinjiangensis]|uniref:Uncharacterized protein n=1 Tax=Saccharothrix xinjiangensis TaxID=204798 RepID=A0ABV9XS79_9PSEU